MRTSVPLCALLIASAAAAPARHLRYAESGSRLVFAFVFGHRDTCRVIRRAGRPRVEFAPLARRRWDASDRGEPGDEVVAELRFGRLGRPVHLVPTDDAKHLLAFANREPDGAAPRSDRVYPLVGRARVRTLDYGALPRETAPAWPRLARALPAKQADPAPDAPVLAYGFVTFEIAPGRILVARQSEGPDELLTELRCFVVEVARAEVALPRTDEAVGLLDHREPLVRAGAAWALGTVGAPRLVAPLEAALGRTTLGAARAEIARAIVRCGEPRGRRTLRALLGAERDVSARRAAARALAQAPDRRDAAALAGALADEDAETARYVGLALVRLGGPGLQALLAVARSSRPEVRAAAARVLGRVDAAAAERRLLALAREGEERVQTAAAVALTSPPRAIHPEHHPDFARALEACRAARNRKAARRLAILAGHAGIGHERVLEALVALAVLEPKAIWALRRLTGIDLETDEEWRAWWRGRGG
ncbi:MAG: hypothetical protein ACYTEZ_09190 [Planctomycetota bacterium]